MFCKNCSPSRSFCHLHLSMPGVDRCCKRQTLGLFKCHKSQTECLECSKTPGRRSRTPPLLSAFRARASALQASRHLLSNLTTDNSSSVTVIKARYRLLTQVGVCASPRACFCVKYTQNSYSVNSINTVSVNLEQSYTYLLYRHYLMILSSLLL